MEQVTICKVKMNDRGYGSWFVIRCDEDPGWVGEVTACGLSRADILPIGTERIVTLKIPSREKEKA